MKTTPAKLAALLVLTLVCAHCGSQDTTATPPVADSNPADQSAGEAPSPDASSEQNVLAMPADWSPSLWHTTQSPHVPPAEERLAARAESAGLSEEAYLSTPRIAPGATIDGRFVHDLWAIAELSESYARTDDESAWAPFLCRMPSPGSGQISEAEGTSGHARKLYYLYARNQHSYVTLGKQGAESEAIASIPARQAVVKRAFAPNPLTPEQTLLARRLASSGWLKPDERALLDQAYAPELRGLSLPPTTNAEGACFAPGQAAGLFVLFRPEHDLDRTDQGWVYGTLSASGEITACGLIESCMGCHEDASYQRLFGPR